SAASSSAIAPTTSRALCRCSSASAAPSDAMRRLLACALLLIVVAARGFAAAPFDVEVKGVHAPEAIVVATLELRDVVPDRFRKTLDQGGALHLRIEAELWEARPVWDRLVYPAIVRMFRFTRAAGKNVAIVDPEGQVTTAASVPAVMPVDINLGEIAPIAGSSRYYLHAVATLGTLAEREADDGGGARFGRPAGANGLGSLGRIVFRTVLQISDYLQSVSADTKSRHMTGSTILKKP